MLFFKTSFLLSALLLNTLPPQAASHLQVCQQKVQDAERLFEQSAQNTMSIGDVKAQLQHLVNIDQLMRNCWISVSQTIEPQVQKELMMSFAKDIQRLDHQSQLALQKIIQRHGWPTLSRFGEIATQNAWLLAQHADQTPKFQTQVLDLMRPLLAKREVSPSHYAYLYDRVAVNTQKKQRFGTQGRCTEQGWQAFPLETPEKLSELRKEAGLEPFETYQKKVNQYCPKIPLKKNKNKL